MRQKIKHGTHFADEEEEEMEVEKIGGILKRKNVCYIHTSVAVDTLAKQGDLLGEKKRRRRRRFARVSAFLIKS